MALPHNTRYFYLDVPQTPQSLYVNLISFFHIPFPHPDSWLMLFPYSRSQTRCLGSSLSCPTYRPHPVIYFLNVLNHLSLIILNITPLIYFWIWGLEWRVKSMDLRVKRECQLLHLPACEQPWEAVLGNSLWHLLIWRWVIHCLLHFLNFSHSHTYT